MFNLLQRYILKLPTILYEYDKSVCVFGGGETKKTHVAQAGLKLVT